MTQTTLRNKTFISFAWMLSGTFGQNLLQFFTLIILARKLSPAEFGVVSAAMIVIGFLRIFAELGVGPAVVQSTELTDAKISTAMSMSVILSLFLSIVVYVMADMFAVFFAMPDLILILKVLCFMLPIAGFSVVGQAILQREMQFKKITILNSVSYFVGYGCVAIPLALNGFGVWSLVFAYLAQTLTVTLIIFVILTKKYKFGFSFDEARSLLNFGAGFSIARIANYVAGQGDNLIVGRFLGAEALGFYGRAYQLMSMPAMLFGNAMDRVLFPAMASIQEQQERLSRIYVRSVALIAMFSLPLSAILIVVAEEIVQLLLGVRWMTIVLPFRILALCLVFRMSYKISDSLVRAKGAVYNRAWRQVIYAILVFSFAWGGHFWGIAGVAVGIALSVFVNFLLMLQLSKAMLRFSWWSLFLIHLRHTGIALWVAVWVFGVKFLLLGADLHYLLILILSICVGGLAFLSVWCFLKRAFGEEGDYLITIAQPVLTKLKENFRFNNRFK